MTTRFPAQEFALKLVRPALVAAIGVGLVMSGTAGAAVKKPACVSFTDPAGDTGVEGSVPVSDPAVDITNVKLGYAKKTITAAVTVSKYATKSTYSTGVRFDVNFTTPSGKEITLFGQHSADEAVMSQAFAFSGIKVDSSYVSGSNKLVTVGNNGNTFTMTVSLGDVEAALGDKLAGKSISDVNAIAWGGYEAVSVPYDDAAGGKPSKLVDCV